MNQELRCFREQIMTVFEAANHFVSSSLELMPTLPEQGLDSILLSALLLNSYQQSFSAGDWSCVFDVGFVGGKRHYQNKEIGDILVSLRYHKRNKFNYGKLIFLQSKRLKATAQKSGQGTTWHFKKNSPYPELDLTASAHTQHQRILRYEKKKGVRVFYLLYNPRSVPISVTLPAKHTFTPLDVGARVIAARDIKVTKGIYSSLAAIKPNRSIQEFMADLVLCNHGHRISDQGDFEVQRSTFVESVALWEMTLDIQVPEDFDFPIAEGE